MNGIQIKKTDSNIVIKWQLSKIVIPIKDIYAIDKDETYGGEDKQAIRIGNPYMTTDRIVIRTVKDTYILFTTNVTTLENKLKTYINEGN